VNTAIQRKHAEVLADSTRSTLGAICGAEPVLEKGGPAEPEAGSVQGVIAVVGDLSWSLSLAFAPATAESIARKFSGFDIAYDSADMDDVIGELANVMAGDVAARLDRLGFKVSISLPTVARGSDLHLMQPGAVSMLKMRFKLPQGHAWVGLAVAKDRAA
jgi:CheY-specific phosphatase CheX